MWNALFQVRLDGLLVRKLHPYIRKVKLKDIPAIAFFHSREKNKTFMNSVSHKNNRTHASLKKMPVC